MGINGYIIRCFLQIAIKKEGITPFFFDAIYFITQGCSLMLILIWILPLESVIV